MVNKRTDRGETALMLAVSKEHLGCIQVLLENGADPDVPNQDKETPLYRGSGINQEVGGSESTLLLFALATGSPVCPITQPVR